MAFNFPLGKHGAPGAKKPMAKKPNPNAMPQQQPAPDQEQMQPGQDEQDGAAVAAEHGPAQDVNVMHDEASGQHHVTSTHPDGHMHESSHPTASAAHKHAAKLAGAESEGGEPHAAAPEEDDWK